MGLELEIVGGIREIAEGETLPTRGKFFLKKLRDSHHTPARLLARGLTDTEVSHLTGYTPARLQQLRHDPLFAGLIETYKRDNREVEESVELKFKLLMLDARQELHERLLDSPEAMSTEEVAQVFKLMADRAGFAPVQRSINKNLNLNIGTRLDEARRRKEEG